ncbi:MAG: hypothetical protein J6S14_01735 [Clostridia bacterium]|nr:hypothetical protein [Clostridia bacterium]
MNYPNAKYKKVKERKPPASERFYSFQAVGRGAARLKCKEIFDRCGGRQGRCPLTPRTFEKVRSKLPVTVVFYLIGNFRSRKFTFILPQANHHSAQADYHSREA